MSDDERRLYAVPPACFVSARKDLAKRLKAAGDSAEATRVDRLKKPSLSVWATNQLAHEDQVALAGYLEAHHRARERQLRALAGLDPDAAALTTTAVRQERRHLEALVDRARQHLERAGLAASKTHLDRVRTNLRAAVVVPEVQSRLEQGWLTEDLDEPGFDALTATLKETRPDWLQQEISRLAAIAEERRETEPKAAEPANDLGSAKTPPTPPSPASEARRVEAARRAEREMARAGQRRALELELERSRQQAHEAAQRRQLAQEERAMAERMVAAANADVATRSQVIRRIEAELEQARAELDVAIAARSKAAASLEARRSMASTRSEEEAAADANREKAEAAFRAFLKVSETDAPPE